MGTPKRPHERGYAICARKLDPSTLAPHLEADAAETDQHHGPSRRFRNGSRTGTGDWAMMLIGFGGVSLQMRRHGRKGSFLAQIA